MRHIFLLTLSFFFVRGFSQSYATVNLLSYGLGSSAMVNVYMNEELIGTVGDYEAIEAKIYSAGRITITVIYQQAYIRRTSTIDVERGKTYFMEMKNNYTYSLSNDWESMKGTVKKTIKFEENRHRPLIAGVADEGPKQGTCFLVSKKGYVITNYHVIKDSKTIQIKGVGGDYSSSYGADIVAVDADNDLALLKFKNQNMVFDEPPYSISKTTCPQGSKAFVLGYPMAKSMGDEIKLTDGIISAKSGFKGSVSQYQFSAPIQPGNSGSPLFNESGEVVGVASAKIEGAEGVGYAIKSQYLLTFFSLIDNFSLTPTASASPLKTMAYGDKVEKIKGFVYIVKSEGE